MLTDGKPLGSQQDVILKPDAAFYDVVDNMVDPAEPGDRQGLSYVFIAGAFWRYRLFIVLCCLLGSGAGIAGLRLLPEHYKSSVSILLDPKRSDALGANEEFGEAPVDSGKVADVEQILVSSRLLEKVVRSEHLADDPRFGGEIDSAPRRLLEVLTGQRGPRADTPAIRTERAIARLGKMISTARVGLTYVITVTVTAPAPQEAQHLAGAVADAYIGDQLATKYADARDDAAWLEDRLNHLRPELLASDARVLAIRHQYGLYQASNTADSVINRQKLTDLTTELAKAQGEAAEAGAQYAQASRTLQAGGSPDVGRSVALDNLRASTTEAERRVANLSGMYGPHHPLRVEADRSLAALQARMHAEDARLTSELHAQYDAALARVASVQALLRTIVHNESAADNVSGRAQLNEAERIAEVNRTTYEATLNRLHDMEQQVTRQKAEARIISPAPFPERPSFPRPIVCLPVGAALGMVAGMAIALLRRLLRDRVDDPETAERQLRLTVLGVIPRLTPRELGAGRGESHILLHLQQDAHSAFADGLRRLHIALRRVAGPGVKVVQFTSARPGDGKSTLAASMALSAAMSGIKTALVDLDLHNPTVPELFQAICPPAKIAPGARPRSRAAKAIPQPSLPLLVAAADFSRDGSCLLEETVLRSRIAELRQRFELIVLDTPPVFAVSDALMTAQFADASVLVCAVHDTPSDQVRRATQALRGAGANVCGVILNKAGIKAVPYGYSARLRTEQRERQQALLA